MVEGEESNILVDAPDGGVARSETNSPTPTPGHPHHDVVPDQVLMSDSVAQSSTSNRTSQSVQMFMSEVSNCDVHIS